MRTHFDEVMEQDDKYKPALGAISSDKSKFIRDAIISKDMM